MPQKEKKKSWKERQRERQIKQQRAQEAHQVEIEKEAKSKPRQWPKGKILAVVCVLVLIFGAIGAWQLTSSSTPSEEEPPIIPTGGVIYIRPDGQVSPDTAPIVNSGNDHYTLTADTNTPIFVGRDNIVIDGANHAIRGSNELGSSGIDLTGRNNVTITNMKISSFDYGVYLTSASNNVISHNDFTENYCGIWVVTSSNDNTISDNNLESNQMWAIFMKESSNNVISKNEMTSHLNYTIYIRQSNFTTFSGNYIANNNVGIYFYEASGNTVYHNSFVNNREDNSGAVSSSDSINTFDNGKEGNYWSNYQSVYSNATEVGSSGIWNMPYIINENNQDNYPLVDPWT